jgi:hypothetical protein
MHLIQLKTLNLTGNRLQTLPVSLSQLSSLVNLYVDRNPLLSVMPAALCNGLVRVRSNRETERHARGSNKAYTVQYLPVPRNVPAYNSNRTTISPINRSRSRYYLPANAVLFASHQILAAWRNWKSCTSVWRGIRKTVALKFLATGDHFPGKHPLGLGC